MAESALPYSRLDEVDVRGRSNGCLVHPDPHEVSDVEARRRAREA